jgi:hypothetical protein
MRTWLIVPIVLAVLIVGCRKDTPKPSTGADYPAITFTEERPSVGNEKWYVCWGETKDGLAFVLFEQGTPPGGHRILTKPDGQGKNEGWLLKPDGARLQLPTRVQLYEIDGQCREREGRVSLDQLKAFLASKPDRYTIDALLRSVRGGSRPETQPGTAPARREPIYDEKADPQADIAAALARAGQTNKRVLIIYGGNWCSWCYRFHDLLEKDPDIRRAVERSYEQVRVEAVKNPGIGTKYRIDPQKGYPYLTVLDTNGKVVANQETGVFEERKGYKPKVVLDFFLKSGPDAASRPAATRADTSRS